MKAVYIGSIIAHCVRHDEMATQIGINERSFVEVNLDDFQHLQRCFGEYIKDLTVRNKSKRKSETAGQPTQATMVPADVPKEMPADVPTDMPAISVKIGRAHV